MPLTEAFACSHIEVLGYHPALNPWLVYVSLGQSAQQWGHIPQALGHPCSLSGRKAKEKEAGDVGDKGNMENMAVWGCTDIVEM